MGIQIFLGNPPANVEQWIKNQRLKEPLCFTAEQVNSTVRLDKVGSPDAISLETSTDGNTWTDYSWTDKTSDTLTLANVGDKVYMRAKTENQTIGKYSVHYYGFRMSGKIAASGNIQTLLKADGSRTDVPAHCYNLMFSGCTSLTHAPALPATTLADGCYSSMFANCTSLTHAPALPATTLADGCYSSMFYDCTSLISAPVLPATTLAKNCYYYMFYNCSQLGSVPGSTPVVYVQGSFDKVLANNMFLGCINSLEYSMPNQLVSELSKSSIRDIGIGFDSSYNKYLAIVYCSDGYIVLNDNSGSSGS